MNRSFNYTLLQGLAIPIYIYIFFHRSTVGGFQPSTPKTKAKNCVSMVQFKLVFSIMVRYAECHELLCLCFRFILCLVFVDVSIAFVWPAFFSQLLSLMSTLTNALRRSPPSIIRSTYQRTCKIGVLPRFTIFILQCTTFVYNLRWPKKYKHQMPPRCLQYPVTPRNTTICQATVPISLILIPEPSWPWRWCCRAIV